MEVGKLSIEFIPDEGSGSELIVNGITIMECIGYEEFLGLKINEIVTYYDEMKQNLDK